MQTLTLTDGLAEVVIAPALGAGLVGYEFIRGDRHEPLFRRCRSVATATPFDLACNLLVPWSNRISGGGFRFRGRFHALEPNLAGEPLPIHGNGFSSEWEVAGASGLSAALTLDSQGPGLYKYAAEVRYTLDTGALKVGFKVINRGPFALPFGLGLHPWFPRTQDTTLRARATNLSLEGPFHLPADQVPVSEREDWNFSRARRLPPGWINNEFSGWDGRAEIVWADRGLRLQVDTEGNPNLNAYIVYSPSENASFFCFEPVTHLIDAHNRPGGPTTHGLVVLHKGEELAVDCRFSPDLA